MRTEYIVGEIEVSGEPYKPFPYYPPQPTEREVTRMELMMELNKWDNNNKSIAKCHADTLIKVLQEQFGIEPAKTVYVQENG